MTALTRGGRRPLLLAAALTLALALAACGDAGSTGTTNVQGGTGRAPGAPPVDAQPTPARTSTPTPVR
jgi:hypothetical protein